MKGFEEALLLESLAIKRSALLSNLTSEHKTDVSTVQHDNILTDIEMQQHFRGYKPQVKEVHFKRCEESGIPQCTCIIKGTGGSEVL